MVTSTLTGQVTAALGVAPTNNGASGLLQLDSSGNIPNLPINASTSGSTPSAGTVGSVVMSDIPVGSAAAPPGGSGSTNNLTSVSLTAGNWLCFGNIAATGTGSSSIYQAQMSLTSGAFAASETGGLVFSADPLPTGPWLFSVNTTKTLYLVYSLTYSGSVGVYGSLVAVRMP